MIDRRQRQVHRRRRPPPLQLQMPLEIPDRVIPREHISQRITAPGRIGGEPLDEPGDLPGVSRRVRSDNGWRSSHTS